MFQYITLNVVNRISGSQNINILLDYKAIIILIPNWWLGHNLLFLLEMEIVYNKIDKMFMLNHLKIVHRHAWVT